MSPDPKRPSTQTNQADAALRPRRESVEEQKLRGDRQSVEPRDDSGEKVRQPDRKPDPRV